MSQLSFLAQELGLPTLIVVFIIYVILRGEVSFRYPARGTRSRTGMRPNRTDRDGSGPLLVSRYRVKWYERPTWLGGSSTPETELEPTTLDGKRWRVGQAGAPIDASSAPRASNPRQSNR